MPCPGKLGLMLFCAAAVLPAQKVVSARAGLITFVQGSAFVDGKRLILRSTRFTQMQDGETLSTGRGRAELLLAPGVVMRLSEDSRLRMDDTQLSDTRVTLERGDALVEVVQLAERSRIQLNLAETTTEPTRPGLYRFGISQNTPAKNTLRVYGGEALVRSGTAMAVVKRGSTVNLSPDLAVVKFDRKQTDMLHAWAARRSFELFMNDPETRLKQTHWQPAGGGYVENKNFGVEFRAFIRRAPATPGYRPAIPRADTR